MDSLCHLSVRDWRQRQPFYHAAPKTTIHGLPPLEFLEAVTCLLWALVAVREVVVWLPCLVRRRWDVLVLVAEPLDFALRFLGVRFACLRDFSGGYWLLFFIEKFNLAKTSSGSFTPTPSLGCYLHYLSFAHTVLAEVGYTTSLRVDCEGSPMVGSGRCRFCFSFSWLALLLNCVIGMRAVTVIVGLMVVLSFFTTFWVFESFCNLMQRMF